MAVTHFIQTIWSKRIQDDLELKCKLVANCLREYEGDCKFNDCLHEHEPGCAIKKAVEAQEITQEHYETYLSLLEDLKNRKERY